MESKVTDVVEGDKPNTEGSALAVYVLYLVALVFGITGIIGVVIAYLNREEAPEWLKTHYVFQVRTFWIGALYMLIGTLLLFVAIGYFVFLFWIVWLIVRCIKGMKYLNRQQAYPEPSSWFF